MFHKKKPKPKPMSQEERPIPDRESSIEIRLDRVNRRAQALEEQAEVIRRKVAPNIPPLPTP